MAVQKQRAKRPRNVWATPAPEPPTSDNSTKVTLNASAIGLFPAGVSTDDMMREMEALCTPEHEAAFELERMGVVLDSDTPPPPTTPPDCAHWTQTFSGRAFYPLSPSSDDVTIIDIAHHLSQVCRYTGATSSFYSVAEHSCRVETLVAEMLGRLRVPMHERAAIQLRALLHDASEAYIADVSRPVKTAAQMAEYREIEGRVQAVVEQAFDIRDLRDDTVEALARSVIRDADLILMATERRDLLGKTPSGHEWNLSHEPLFTHIQPWSPTIAKARMLDRFTTLFKWHLDTRAC